MVANQRGVEVLAVLDEFNNLQAQDTSAMASANQQLAKDQGKSVALLGAGLAHMERTPLPHKGFTFFQFKRYQNFECLLRTRPRLSSRNLK